jgi:heavy metal sensor kinase
VIQADEAKGESNALHCTTRGRIVSLRAANMQGYVNGSFTMRHRSLKSKLTLWFAFILILIVPLSDYLTYRVLRRIILAEINPALVSMATLQGVALQMAVFLLAMDIVTVVAVIVGAYLIVGKALRPVDHITERAHQIGAGDLHQRLEYIDSSSEMVRLTEVLNEMLEKLCRLFESQKQFVQDASHEIRSPLAALICRLEVALRQERSAQDYRRVIESSLEDASRLRSLADDLITLARADLDSLSMEFREVSLFDVLAEIHERLSPLAESHQIAFVLDARPDCVVYADRSRIEQVFRNLAENSLKYTPCGGRVVMRMRYEGEYVRTDIEDTGIGIPEVEQEKVFRRFYRLDHARSRDDGGTGLGLAICDQIIRFHLGRIEVDSAQGRGTRFTVYLASAAALLDAPAL